MRKTLLTYVKPHVQEDPLSMILGIGYLGAQLEREKIPVALHDERVGTDQEMKEVIAQNDIIAPACGTTKLGDYVASVSRGLAAEAAA